MFTENDTLTRRRNALTALIVATIPLAASFCVLNISLDSRLLALLNALLLFMCIWLLLRLRRRHISTVLALLYLVPVFGNFLWIVTLPDIYPTAHAWLPALPVMAYLLLEPRLGLRVTVATLMVAAPAYIVGAQREPALLDLTGYSNVMAPVLGVFIVCHFYTRSHARVHSDMLTRIFTDPLTGLWNRQKFAGEFEREQQRVQRTGMPFSLILLDLDHFKNLNDSHGHDAGDAALVFFAKLLKGRGRRTDLPCRIGGEEFVVLLPETDTGDAMKVAEDLRLALVNSDFHYDGKRIGMTLSAGIVEFGRDGVTWPQLYRAADARLYACKERGRNCVLSTLSERAAA